MIQFNNKPPKKLIVKNLKNKPRISEEFEASALARISATIDAVFKDETLPYGHEDIYRSCETLCKFHQGNAVYKILYEKCEREALKSAEKLVKECSELMNEIDYLKKFENSWKSFRKHYTILESLFLYLDRVFITQQQQPQHHQLLQIKRFGLNFFRSYALNNSSSLGLEMVERLSRLIERIRQDRLTEESEQIILVSRLIKMIRELDEYSQGDLMFEKTFLQGTWNFYENESRSQIEKAGLSIPEYLKYCEGRLEYESSVVNEMIAPITSEKLIRCVRERLISDRLEFLFPKPAGSSLKTLFDASDSCSLKLLFEMVYGVFAIEKMAAEWMSFVRRRGSELMAKGNDFRTIEKIVEFKEQVDLIVKECFQCDPSIQGTLKDAFEAVMNGRGDRGAELLALYVHHKIMGACPDKIQTTESQLAMALLLFRYLYRKDAFDAFYKRTLAQRLLFQSSKDLSLERQFIGRLREECGGGFVSRMESMLKDVEQSADMTKSFASSGSKPTGIASVTLVTVISGLWPCNPASQVSVGMPSELSKLEDSFSSFYAAQKKNCSLKWFEELGSCTMRANFRAGRYNLMLTVPQALVLLKFNSPENNPIPRSKLSKDLQISAETLDYTLNSLSSKVFPILLVNAADVEVEVEVEVEESFKINEDFVWGGPGRLVPVYALQSPFLSVEDEIISEGFSGEGKEGENGDELSSKEPLKNAIQDRQHQVDSLLVRRMKHQQRCPRKDLINFALANLGGLRVSSSDVDGRIEELIAKEYMKMADDGEIIIYQP